MTFVINKQNPERPQKGDQSKFSRLNNFGQGQQIWVHKAKLYNVPFCLFKLTK